MQQGVCHRLTQSDLHHLTTQLRIHMPFDQAHPNSNEGLAHNSTLCINVRRPAQQLGPLDGHEVATSP